MYRIIVKNLITNKDYSAKFPTEEECWEWTESKWHVHGSSTIHPATATVEIKNIDQEILAEKSEIDKAKQSYKDLKAVDWSTISDPVVRKILKDTFVLLKYIIKELP